MAPQRSRRPRRSAAEIEEDNQRKAEERARKSAETAARKRKRDEERLQKEREEAQAAQRQEDARQNILRNVEEKPSLFDNQSWRDMISRLETVTSTFRFHCLIYPGANFGAPRLPLLGLSGYTKLRPPVDKPPHMRQIKNLPPNLEELPLDPGYWFDLIWPRELVETLCENTNKYADKQRNPASADNEDIEPEEDEPTSSSAREWHPTTLSDIYIWLSYIVCMGVYKIGCEVVEYWSTENLAPKHPMMSYMSRNRFQLIKRYFHVSDPNIETRYWYEKVQPASSIVLKKSRHNMIPATDVAVDKMIVEFTGRSKDKIKAPHKPINEGYELFGLAEHGYTYDLAFSSGVEGQPEVPSDPVLNATSSIVLHLAQKLPHKDYHFNVFMDNRFATVALFERLRDQNMGACGTTRAGYKNWPEEWKEIKTSAGKLHSPQLFSPFNSFRYYSGCFRVWRSDGLSRRHRKQEECACLGLDRLQRGDGSYNNP